jgi:hypothetical protein
MSTPAFTVALGPHEWLSFFLGMVAFPSLPFPLPLPFPPPSPRLRPPILPPLARMTPSTSTLQYNEKLNAECDGLDVRGTPNDTSLYRRPNTPRSSLRFSFFSSSFVVSSSVMFPSGLGTGIILGVQGCRCRQGRDCFLFVLESVEEFCFPCPVVVRSLCCALTGGRQPRLGRGRAGCSGSTRAPA